MKGFVLISILAALAASEAVRTSSSHLYWNVAFHLMRFMRLILYFLGLIERKKTTGVSWFLPLLFVFFILFSLFVLLLRWKFRWETTFVNALCSHQHQALLKRVISFVVQEASVWTEAALSRPWHLVNTCSVCVSTVLRAFAVRQVRIWAHRPNCIHIIWLKASCCSCSERGSVLRGSGTLLQRHRV